MSLISDQTRYQPRRPAAKFEEPSQPWTTARCHRLLRPLVSRIASLRKGNVITGQAKASTVKSTSGLVSASTASNSDHYAEPNAESEWLMPRKKRPRLTYSQRRGARAPQPRHDGPDQSQLGQGNHDEDTSLAPGVKSGVKKAFKSIQPEGQRKTSSPGEIVPSTPILRRARGKFVLSPVAPVPELDLSSNQAWLDRGHRTKTGSSSLKRLEERLISLRESQPSKYADFEAIFRSLEALLKATTIRTVHSSSAAGGPRSFLDMCLRKVPQYIAELEAWERFDAEQSGTVSTLDDIDTSALIYNELESLGTNVGWRHLRVVVRADGLNAVKLGIEEGLFGDEFSQLIIDLCVQLGAASEAEDLATALVDRQYPQPSSTESCFAQTTALRPLVALISFATKTQRTPFLFRQCSMLLSSGRLPIDWLATLEFERIWSLAVHGLASARHSYDAICFIAQSILLLCKRKHMYNGNTDTIQLEYDIAKASQRTLMSVLGIITSMSLLGETELETARLPESDIHRVMVIGDRLKHIIRTCINELDTHTRGRGNPRVGLLYMALFFSSGQSQGEKISTRVGDSMRKLSLPNLASLSTKDIRTRNHYDSVTWLIASIARACGRGTSVASHQYLDGLSKRLESLKLGQNLLDNLKAAAAFLIAQQTNNVRDLIYAESLHPHDRSSSGATSHQHNGSTLFTGYRWEETIGEWVTASPVAGKRRAPTIKRPFRPSSPAESTGSLVSRPSNSTSPVTDSVSDAKTCLYQGMNDGEPNINECTRPTYDGQGMMLKKRPRRFGSTEALTTLVRKALPPQHPGLQESQDDPEKENRVRLLAKKPRRSSGRIVLGARSLTRDSIGRRDKYGRDRDFSDDELCI
ncbi:hypothetical protein F4801DRAFT_547055 [Xylaria longipes]|nr:hypothetical protein F4801DRAFT_547055 [Xylaria longipes]RYC64058.1 hypothetical protein CHU98_g2171 [Xylaria longipes]